MATNSDDPHTPEDALSDDAIRRELIRIVQDDEARMLALMDSRMALVCDQVETEIKDQPEASRIKFEEVRKRVLNQLHAAKSRLSRHYVQMRDFIERE